jgi:ASC-1-like (ASCH) protein
MKYRKHISEPWFSLINFKIKTVEGILNKEYFANMQINDTIIFVNDELLELVRECEVIITNISEYDTFQSYLEIETLEKCLPGIYTIENGVKIYNTVYDYDREYNALRYSVKAFTIQKPTKINFTF